MNLRDIGFTDSLENSTRALTFDGCEPGRVVCEQKERYFVVTSSGECEAVISGALRYTAVDRGDFPAVGDWVLLRPNDLGPSVIHAILPRRSVIARSSVAGRGERQILATNVDSGLIVQAADRDFSINRLERYLALCLDSNVEPLVILNKVDLVDASRLEAMLSQVRGRVGTVPVLAVSNATRFGYGELEAHIVRGQSYCLLGSSGVGKSTLLNALAGRDAMKTGAIGEGTNRGRHITSYRELFVLENGAIVIDNPGLREVGLADVEDGLEATFPKIVALSRSCRFADCTHTSEAGCAVRAAVLSGSIDEAALENYLKLEKERRFFESTAVERRQKEKAFGRSLSSFRKQLKKDREW